MNKDKAGSRVGAIMAASNTEVEFLGYGVYEGDHPRGNARAAVLELREEDPEWMKEKTTEELVVMLADSPLFKNPRIKLDNGDTVWGCECWWGPEDQIKAKIGTRAIKHVRITRDEEGNALDTVEYAPQEHEQKEKATA